MSNNKFITNPQAIEFINQVKTGQIWVPVKTKLKQYKWFFFGGLTLFILLLAILIGKILSQKATPVFIPPIIEVTTTSPQVTQKTSVFSGLKRSILDLNLQLPDPAIPSFDNNISLEQAPL